MAMFLHRKANRTLVIILLNCPQDSYPLPQHCCGPQYELSCFSAMGESWNLTSVFIFFIVSGGLLGAAG